MTFHCLFVTFMEHAPPRGLFSSQAHRKVLLSLSPLVADRQGLRVLTAAVSPALPAGTYSSSLCFQSDSSNESLFGPCRCLGRTVGGLELAHITFSALMCKPLGSDFQSKSGLAAPWGTFLGGCSVLACLEGLGKSLGNPSDGLVRIAGVCFPWSSCQLHHYLCCEVSILRKII